MLGLILQQPVQCASHPVVLEQLLDRLITISMPEITQSQLTLSPQHTQHNTVQQ